MQAPMKVDDSMGSLKSALSGWFHVGNMISRRWAHNVLANSFPAIIQILPSPAVTKHSTCTKSSSAVTHPSFAMLAKKEPLWQLEISSLILAPGTSAYNMDRNQKLVSWTCLMTTKFSLKRWLVSCTAPPILIPRGLGKSFAIPLQLVYTPR